MRTLEQLKSLNDAFNETVNCDWVYVVFGSGRTANAVRKNNLSPFLILGATEKELSEFPGIGTNIAKEITQRFDKRFL